MNNPCVGCPRKVEDEYGLFCDMACGKHTAYVNYQAGIKEAVEFINNLIIGIEGCEFEERLDGDKGCIVLDMNENQWHDKLKEWGIENEV